MRKIMARSRDRNWKFLYSFLIDEIFEHANVETSIVSPEELLCRFFVFVVV